MFTRPSSLSDGAISSALATHWGLSVDRAEYAPVGFGSHHWFVGTAARWEWFVTVDELSAKTRTPNEPLDRPFDRLVAAFTTARDLADAGHDFVVAPQRARDGQVLHRLDDRFTVACFPYIEGLVGDHGRYRSTPLRNEVVRTLVALHEIDPAGAPRCGVEDFELSNRDELVDALDHTDESWDAGPHAETARKLLRKNADSVVELLGRYDAAVVEAEQTRQRWVLTHGEPHGSNVLSIRDDVRLIDWDTALVGPPERDVWHVDPDNTTATRLYLDSGGRALDARIMDLYRAQWDLSEIAGYITLFRREHEDTADARESVRNLTHYLEAERLHGSAETRWGRGLRIPTVRW